MPAPLLTNPSRFFPVLWQTLWPAVRRGAPGTLLLLLAMYALGIHAEYLNHLNDKEWGHRYLIVNRGNADFIAKLQRLKLLVTIGWITLFYYASRFVHTRLRANRIPPCHKSTRRLYLALTLWLASLVNYDPPDIELSLYFFINTFCFLICVTGLLLVPGHATACTWIGTRLQRISRLPSAVLCSAAFWLVCMVGYYLGGPFFTHIPLTVDTSAELVHAKMLLSGQWYLKSQPEKEFFDVWMMINNGRWYSQYPPGHLFMLMVGTYFDRRTLVNPVLGGLTAIAVYFLARALYGKRVARLAVVMAGACIYLVAMSSEFMMNATSLLFATVFLAAYFQMLKKPSALVGLLGGAAIGYCFITRPYSAVALGLPYIIHASYLLISKQTRYTKSLIGMAAAGTAFLLFQMYFNTVTNGGAFVFGYQRAWGNWHNPLSHDAIGRLSEFELEKNFRENLQRLAWLNRVMFEWPLPTLFLLVLAYTWRGRRQEEKLLLLTLVSFLASCQVLPGNVEREWGPRLVYESITALLVLSAKALSQIPAFLRCLSPKRRPRAYYYGFAALLLLPAYGFSFEHNLRIDTLKKLYNFYNRGGNPAFYRYVTRNVQPPALVFVPVHLYQAVSFTNPPADDHKVIFANDLGDANHKLATLYPERFVYRAYEAHGEFVVEPYR